MNYRLPIILILFFAISWSSCSEEKSDQSGVLARINDFNLTLDEFQTQLADEIEMDRDFKLTEEARKNFLEDIIRKELLIQQAKKMNLDKEERFIRTIERYWESTLIRDLMEAKGTEIEQKILISQDEIKDRYNTMKKTRKDLPPLEAMEEEITRELKEIKKTRKLKEWIDSLRTSAKIEINEKLLYQD